MTAREGIQPITIEQARTLDRIVDLRDRFGACGMFVSGPGHASHLRALERRGWVRFAGRGCDLDGIREGWELPIYEITPAGEQALAAWRVEGPAVLP